MPSVSRVFAAIQAVLTRAMLRLQPQHRSLASGIALVLACTAAQGASHPSDISLIPTQPNDSTQKLSTPAMADRMLACTACHGTDGRAGPDGYYPRLAGKPSGYLYQQLLNFRDGYRVYEPMAVLLRRLPDAYLHEMASFFANQHPPYPPPERSQMSQEQRQRGAALIFRGDSTQQIPACVSCHGDNLAGSEPGIPGLLGLSRDYLTAQLGAWQVGTRRTPQPDCMANIVGRLAPSDLAAVAAWLSSQPVPNDYRPAAVPPAALPLNCHTQQPTETRP